MPIQKLPRRNFIKTTGLFTAGLLAYRSSSAMITGLINTPLSCNIPTDKNIDPVWIKSLYKRGKPTIYLKSKNELQYIGMPVGGINCGTLYLGGDGRLWLWDIFNKNQEGIEPKEVMWSNEGQPERKILSRDGACYIKPSKNIRPIEQGFAIKIEHAGKIIIKELNSNSWEEISFEATYPIATIRYTDKNIPVSIKLEAYSPFIPLEEDNSGLPATILSFQITNKTNDLVKVELLGWLENAINKFSAKAGDGNKVNSIIKNKNNIVVFSQFNAVDINKLSAAGDTGSMTLSLINTTGIAIASLNEFPVTEASFIEKENLKFSKDASEKLIGALKTVHEIKPGKTTSINFSISWHFKNVGKRIDIPDAASGNYYASKYRDAFAVNNYIVNKFSYLSSQTHLWKDTWYDATLPHWFMERTFMNISTMATTTSHRFATGRSWAWEGVGACEGNCLHVWQYAQAAGRIFPALEKDNRQRVDLGLSLMEDGGIWFRGEYNKNPAIDGQAGTVLRIYREHQMSADNIFLKDNWQHIKRATQFIINQDRNKDGMEDTPMENTLDAVWDGEIAWIVGLCIAAVKAGEKMAEEMNDTAFVATCKSYVEKGKHNMEDHLFNGEYFIHRADAIKGRAHLGSYNTCHIDQLFGQSWAFQLGLGRLVDKEKTMSALHALWKYNFKEDVGPYIKEHIGGRPYALAGEAGMIMNTNPANEPKPYGEDVTWQMGYFHECMSGFEHQVASHMMAEGMTDEALILTRAVHDRYNAYKRNPFNEIECSDHYARAMASYGTFITACGFEYHGPKGYIKFAPKWNVTDFKAPFVTAKGWGAYTQKKLGNKTVYQFNIKSGYLQLQNISLEKVGLKKVKHISVMLDNKKIAIAFHEEDKNIYIDLASSLRIQSGQSLKILADI